MNEEKVRKIARAKLVYRLDPNDVKVDDESEIVSARRGVWVQAWVWVDEEETQS